MKMPMIRAMSGRGVRHLAHLTSAVALAVMFVPASASAASEDVDQTGEIKQKLAEAGCVSQTGADGDLGMTCADERALRSSVDIALSLDGKSLYVASFLGSAVAVFDRGPDGTLTQKAGQAGCISQTGADGDLGNTCADGRGLQEAHGVVVSPDGKSVYVTSLLGSAVAVFDRGPDGTLTQKAGQAGCISQTGADGDLGNTCADGRGLQQAVDLVVSPDGKSVYVTSVLGDAVAVFDRAADGTLTQKPGQAGCISQTGADGDLGNTCADGRGLDGAHAVTISPDGKSLYAASPLVGNAVAVFDRAADGTLTQKPGQAGCISQTGADGDLGNTCADGRGLDGAHGVAVSPDGKSLYVPSLLGDAVAVFDRAADGTLTQKPGQPGCISQTGADGDLGNTCADGRGIDGGVPVVVSPDGKSLYVGGLFFGDSVAVFDRTPAPTGDGA